jgi:hypothetical protein
VNFRCEDLPEHGLVLVPPSSKDYDPLLSDIQRRLADPVDGSPPLPEQFRPRIVPEDRPTSAILLNRSPKSIAALQVIWRFETETGRSYRDSQGILSPRGLLLPFDRPNDAQLQLYGYWNSILPGSRRYLGKSGMVGDNTDVRLPAEQEKWRGGILAGGGHGSVTGRDPIRQVTLVLDGVFFLDGEFVGPNAEKLFERSVADAEAHLIVARIAKEGHNKGLPPRDILAEIEQATGPAPERPSMDLAFRNAGASQEDFRRAALQTLAFQLALRSRSRQTPNEEQTVFMVLAWNDTVLPHLRKGD